MIFLWWCFKNLIFSCYVKLGDNEVNYFYIIFLLCF